MTHATWDWKTHTTTEPKDEIFDCQVAEFLITHGRSVPSQEVVLLKYGVTTLDQLAEKQCQKLAESPELLQYFQGTEMAVSRVLFHMERAGIHLDAAALRALGEELDEELAKLSQIMMQVVGLRD